MAAFGARERLPQRLPDIVFLTAALLLLLAGIFLATFFAMLGRPDTVESSLLAQSQADYQGEPSAPLFEPLDPDILDEIREDEEALQQSPTPPSEEAVQAEVQESDSAVAPDVEAAANTPAAGAPAATSATLSPSPSHSATAPPPTVSQTPAPGIVAPRPSPPPTSSVFYRPTATAAATAPPTNTPSAPAQASATPAPASNDSPTATPSPAPTQTKPPPTNAVATSPPQATAAASATPAPTNTPRPAIGPSATLPASATNTPRPAPTNTPRPAPTQTPRPAPTNTPVPAPSATPVPQPTETAILVEVPAQLSPLLECVQDNGDGSYTAYFGYVNPNSAAVTISVGKDNRLVPPPEVRGQPTTFQPGRHSRAFTVDFTQGNVLWFLDGSTATAHVGRASCD